MTQQRDAIVAQAPPFLKAHGDPSERFLYTMGLGLDVLLEKMNQATRSRMPGLSDPSAIPYQAADRRLVQGPFETNAAFSLRMRAYLDAWAAAGSRRAVMGQLQAYLQGLNPGVVQAWPQMAIVTANASLAQWDIYAFDDPIGSPPDHTIVSPSNWNWDGRVKPWRAWLILYMQLVSTGIGDVTAHVTSTGSSGVPGVTSGFAVLTNLSGLTQTQVQQYMILTGCASPSNNGTFQIVRVVSPSSCIIANPAAVPGDANNGSITWLVGTYPFLAPAPVWGSADFVWGPGPPGVTALLQSLRQVVQQWKMNGTYYLDIIVSFGGFDGRPGDEFSPNSTQGSGNPDGTWGGNGQAVNGVWVTSKKPLNTFDAFCNGTGQYVQCAVHNVT